MSDEIVRVSCLKHVYPDKTEVSLCGLDFVVRRGERVAVLGPNGSGKTTLLAHLTGLLSPLEGEVSVLGAEPRKDFRRIIKKIGVVFQRVDEQIIGPTVWDDVAFSPRNHGLPRDEVSHRVEAALTEVGILHLKDKMPHYLSGGEKKKVALAGALVMEPELLILDEPFDGLDPRSRNEILDLLNAHSRARGTALVVTTHDVNLVPAIADTVYVMRKGEILASGKPLDIFQRSDLLRQANLEPPALVQLFGELRREGFGVTVPVDLPDALNQMRAILGRLPLTERRDAPGVCRSSGPGFETAGL